MPLKFSAKMAVLVVLYRRVATDLKGFNKEGNSIIFDRNVGNHTGKRH